MTMWTIYRGIVAYEPHLPHAGARARTKQRLHAYHGVCTHNVCTHIYAYVHIVCLQHSEVIYLRKYRTRACMCRVLCTCVTCAYVRMHVDAHECMPKNAHTSTSACIAAARLVSAHDEPWTRPLQPPLSTETSCTVPHRLSTIEYGDCRFSLQQLNM